MSLTPETVLLASLDRPGVGPLARTLYLRGLDPASPPHVVRYALAHARWRAARPRWPDRPRYVDRPDPIGEELRGLRCDLRAILAYLARRGGGR